MKSILVSVLAFLFYGLVSPALPQAEDNVKKYVLMTIARHVEWDYYEYANALANIFGSHAQNYTPENAYKYLEIQNGVVVGEKKSEIQKAWEADDSPNVLNIPNRVDLLQQRLATFKRSFLRFRDDAEKQELAFLALQRIRTLEMLEKQLDTDLRLRLKELFPKELGLSILQINRLAQEFGIDRKTYQELNPRENFVLIEQGIKDESRDDKKETDRDAKRWYDKQRAEQEVIALIEGHRRSGTDKEKWMADVLSDYFGYISSLSKNNSDAEIKVLVPNTGVYKIDEQQVQRLVEQHEITAMARLTIQAYKNGNSAYHIRLANDLEKILRAKPEAMLDFFTRGQTGVTFRSDMHKTIQAVAATIPDEQTHDSLYDAQQAQTILIGLIHEFEQADTAKYRGLMFRERAAAMADHFGYKNGVFTRNKSTSDFERLIFWDKKGIRSTHVGNMRELAEQYLYAKNHDRLFQERKKFAMKAIDAWKAQTQKPELQSLANYLLTLVNDESYLLLHVVGENDSPAANFFVDTRKLFVIFEGSEWYQKH